MKVAFLSALALCPAAAFVPPAQTGRTNVSPNANPVGVGPETQNKILDPLGFTTLGSDWTAKWMRAAELKHGRVSMLATVGWVVDAKGLGNINYPMDGNLNRPFDAANLGHLSTNPLEANQQLWDMGQGGVGWLQIIGTIGILEMVTEAATKPHYMNTDGYIDLFGIKKGGGDLTDLQNKELKNGRLAMLGIAGFVCEGLIPGSNPAYDVFI